MTTTNAPAPRVCPTHNAPLVRRDERGQTYEQKFCGTWWVCTADPLNFHRYTELEQSDALRAQLAEQERSRRTQVNTYRAGKRSKRLRSLCAVCAAEERAGRVESAGRPGDTCEKCKAVRQSGAAR